MWGVLLLVSSKQLLDGIIHLIAFIQESIVFWDTLYLHVYDHIFCCLCCSQGRSEVALHQPQCAQVKNPPYVLCFFAETLAWISDQ
jgi:hypothetical protein